MLNSRVEGLNGTKETSQRSPRVHTKIMGNLFQTASINLKHCLLFVVKFDTVQNKSAIGDYIQRSFLFDILKWLFALLLVVSELNENL